MSDIVKETGPFICKIMMIKGDTFEKASSFANLCIRHDGSITPRYIHSNSWSEEDLSLVFFPNEEKCLFLGIEKGSAIKYDVESGICHTINGDEFTDFIEKI